MFVLALRLALASAPAFAPYVPPDDTFTVDLPAGTVDVKVEKANGGATVTRNYAVQADRTLYLVNVTQDPVIGALGQRLDRNSWLDKIRDGFKEQKRVSSVFAEKRLSLGNAPGREFQVRAVENAVVRAFIDQQTSRSYVLTFVTLSPDGAPDLGSLKRFFGSFRIAGGSATGAVESSDVAPSIARDSTKGSVADSSAAIQGVSVEATSKGGQHLVTVSWVATITGTAGAASITLDSSCRVNGQTQKASNVVAAGPGASVSMTVTLPPLKGKPRWCELAFSWGLPDQPSKSVDRQCWRGDSEPPWPGRCAD